MPGYAPAIPIVVTLVVFWTCIVLGKRVGDELATWVVGHEDNDDLVPEFGIEWIRTHDGRRPSLRAYRYYADRYRQLRLARGEDVRLARRFAVIYWTQWVGVGVGVVAFLVLGLLAS